MDFLEIRKKAKERAQARAAEEAEARSRAAAAPSAAETPPPVPTADLGPGSGLPALTRSEEPARGARAVVTDEDLLEGALAGRLQGLPAAEAPAASGDDARFTTWRPGTGAPLAGLAAPRVQAPEPRPADFAVVAPGARREPAPRHPRSIPEPAREPEPAQEHADPLDEFFFRPDEAGPDLPFLGAGAAREEDGGPSVLVREEYVTFRLGAEEYAVAIERVREVIKAPPVTEVPRAPAHILGVVTVRGEVVAVVDPRRRLGLPASAGPAVASKIVIVDAGDGPCGLLVDRITSVVRLRPGSIEPCPQGIAGQHSEYLAGIGREGERLFTVLDLGALLRRAPPRDAARRADAGA